MAGTPRNSKVTRFPGVIRFNIGMVFFAIILIYVVICIFIYLNTSHVAGYEVMEGSLSSDDVYEAMALRTEKIVSSAYSGYVNYFATEGQRVAVGNLVYTVDESGELLEYLKSQGTEEVSLTDEDYDEMRTQIVGFTSSFRKEDFYTLYDFRDSLSGIVKKLSGTSILNNINSLNAGSLALQSINYCNAFDTGVVIYSVDGYEEKKLRDIKASDFDTTAYERTQLIGNELVSQGDPVYKLCTEENWSIVIHENDPEKVKALEDLVYVKVRFLKNQYESWGKVHTYTNDEGDTFVELSFTNSMITFCKERFLQVELIMEEEKGLKIPNSSIAEKNFFIIPVDYITVSGSSKGVMRERYAEDGTASTEFVAVSIYNESKDGYFVGDESLRSGDILIKPDSDARFTVSRMESLIGVYNINKGYADFRQIRILFQNDEYSIVKPDTMYGLNVYDFIVLDASTVDNDT